MSSAKWRSFGLGLNVLVGKTHNSYKTIQFIMHTPISMQKWLHPLPQNLIKIQQFWYRNITLKMSSVGRRPFCLGTNVLKYMVVANANKSLSTSGCHSGYHARPIKTTGLFCQRFSVTIRIRGNFNRFKLLKANLCTIMYNYEHLSTKNTSCDFVSIPLRDRSI